MNHACLALRQQLKETNKSSSSSWFNKSAVLKEEPERKSRNINKLLSLSTARRSKETRKKVQWLRETRDYSFLSSDQVQDCTHEMIINPGPGNIKPEHSRPSETKKEIKGSKIQGPNKVMIINRDSTKISRIYKKKEEDKYYSRSNNIIISKKTLETRRKRKQSLEQEEEDIKAIGIIRGMFGYDPSKFCDDDDGDDVRIMEANFHDIEKEERRSTKIARKEDAQELRKLSVPNSKKLNQMR